MADYLQEKEPFLQQQQQQQQQDIAGNPPVLADATTSTIAMAMLFGSIIFTTTSLAARLWLTGMWGWRNGITVVDVADVAAVNDINNNNHTTSTTTTTAPKRMERSHSPGHAQPLDTTSLTSIYNLLHYSTIFGLILLYSYICEHHPPYFHEEKTYDRDEFFFWTILVVVFAGGHSLRTNEAIKRRSKGGGGGGVKGGVRGGDSNGNHDHQDRLRRINEEYQLQQEKQQQQQQQQHHQNNNQMENNTPTPTPENEVLNRYQTEEWKGWMQFTFLLYHYMHAMEIYNGIRVMITCYIWMTGFGNFSFFYMTNDYSLPRVLQMLWRLNFLVFFLCLTHGNSYILYYICPLHTYFFFMVYIVMSIGKEKNYTKWWMRIKLGVLALIIYAVWDCDTGIFEPMHSFLFLSQEKTVGATMGSNWEWYFRSYLDHWSTLLGMVFALNFPIVSLFYRKLEARSKKREWMGKLAVAAGMLFVFRLWVNGPLMYSKIPYNSTNPYFGFVPLVTYIYLRNLTPKMRSYSMELLHEIGKTTLETYLMQHHIWLTSNSKTILVFLPGWPRCNLALVTYLYVVSSRKLHQLTLLLRGMLLPDDKGACINSLVGMSVIIAGFYCTAFLLDGVDMISLLTVGVVSMICGALLYQTVIDSSWAIYRKSVKKMKELAEEDLADEYATDAQSEDAAGEDAKDETIYSKLCPPLIGAMVLIVLGSIWNGFAADGASAIGPLPPRCDAFVNDGMWIPIDGCNESSRGMAYRDFGVASYGTCTPHGNSFIWAWKEQPSRTRCRFGHRSEAKVKKSLNRREVVYIGDSMTRFVYHASMRAMGLTESGAYDATGPKHADMYNTLWETTPINFKWAPLAVDQLGVLKEINRQALEDKDTQPPDLIFLGGGAWDRLHVYASDEDRQSHAATLKDLAHEMQTAQEEYGAAVVWFIPTTINSQALNTEEKRDHMREEDMEAMRAVYARNGILSSSSFVIDGPAFTSSRVAESYDGVHYPIQVYDAGAQILFNALDWLLPPGIDDPMTPPRVGKMANPKLGLVMLVLVTIGLVCFDGFLGFSYLASVFVRGVVPHELHEEAFSALHKKIGLPSSDVAGPPPKSSDGQRERTRKNNRGAPTRKEKSMPQMNNTVDEEIAALLGSKQAKPGVELPSWNSRQSNRR